MKVGIFTLFHKNYNWGGALQGYALKTYIETNFPNTKVDLLIYRSNKNVIYKNKFMQALQYSPFEIFAKVTGKLSNKCKYDFVALLKERKARFNDFFEELTTNYKVYTDITLNDVAEEYDCLICGSDQIWNPNVARPGFFLKDIDNSCKKISYAASIARNNLSPKERRIMIPLIQKFDSVSVREKTAKKILEKYVSKDKNITEVIDPTLMLDESMWNDLSLQKSAEEPFALAFFFSESYEYRKKIEEYCKTKNFKLKFIPFARQKYLASDNLGNCDRLYNIGPKEFVRLFQQAECVFTDSFHGSVFSIIFNKSFCVFERDRKTKVSKNSRLYDLLDKFELSKRLIRNINELENIMDTAIDFDRVNVLLKYHRMLSHNFLVDALNLRKIKNSSESIERVDFLPEKHCCGCGLCEAVCPKKCIKMQKDKEGFSYPEINNDICISCGICINECRNKSKNEKLSKPSAFLGYNREEQTRLKSSSGGLFYPLAKKVIAKSGCVYGAAFDEKNMVKHIRVEKLEELPRLMTSKYVQSEINVEMFSQLKKDLMAQKTVLFSGTPCQVAAIRRFTDKNQIGQNLYLVDFICHGVPSPEVWKSYLDYVKNKYSSHISSVNFRDKKYGWHNFMLRIDLRSKCLYESHQINPFMQSFLSDKNIRPSCYYCKNKKSDYFSDLTLGDAWKIEKENLDWADDKGTSLFISRSHKGKDLMLNLYEDFEYCETSVKKWAQFNPSLNAPTGKPDTRKLFFDDFRMLNSLEFWSKYSKISFKKRIRYILKVIFKKTGADKLLRKYM